jgi:hypothetical protein
LCARSCCRRTQPEAGGLHSATSPEGLPRELSEPAAVRVQHAEVMKVAADRGVRMPAAAQ